MQEIINIINENLGPENFPKRSFKGQVFFNTGSGLQMDRSIYNRLLNKYNTAFDGWVEGDLLTTNDDILLAFVNEIFEDNSGNLFRMDRNYYLSAVVLEQGILSMWSEETEGSEKKPDGTFMQLWEDIDFVELFENADGGYFFRFYETGEAKHEDLSSNSFGTSSLLASQKLLAIFNEIIEYQKQAVAASHNEHAELKSEIEQLMDDEQYTEAVELLDHFADTYDVEDVDLNNCSFYYIWKSVSLFYLGRFDEALETIELYIKKNESADIVEAYVYELKGEILSKQNRHLPAIRSLAYSEENYEKEDQKKDVRLLKEESYSRLKEVFLEVPYDERKLVFVSDDIYATRSRDIVVLKKNELPNNIFFPLGHPHLNEVYTCHPHKQNFYLPLKDYSEELFMDRINEFSYLLQCLGATQLEISSSKTSSSDQKVKSGNEVDVKVDYKVSNAKVNYKGENNETTLVDGRLKIAKKQVFKPTKAPYIPENLIWYHSDLNWQRLVDQRLNGSIMTHSELISSSQSENISSHELKQIDAELKLLLPKIGVSYTSENEISTSSNKTHEWVVTVEFEDADMLSQNSYGNEPHRIDSLKDEYALNLEKYREDVLFMLEDDQIIDDSERKLLDRKIKKYGLSEEDARAVENELLTSGYSENELKYIEELKDLLEDGEITGVERKILDRYALRFSISNETQAKIDSLFIDKVRELQ